MTPVIYVDMDGVLVDLEEGLRLYFKDESPTENKGKLFKSYLPEYTKNLGFQTQPKMPHVDRLIEVLKYYINTGKVQVAILTSAGQFYEPISEVVMQKKISIERNFPDLVEIPFCCTTSGADKAIFAHPNAFLLDDHHKNVNAFINAGGHGFVYGGRSNLVTAELVDQAIRSIEDFVHGQVGPC